MKTDIDDFPFDRLLEEAEKEGKGDQNRVELSLIRKTVKYAHEERLSVNKEEYQYFIEKVLNVYSLTIGLLKNGDCKIQVDMVGGGLSICMIWGNANADDIHWVKIGTCEFEGSGKNGHILSYYLSEAW